MLYKSAKESVLADQAWKLTLPLDAQKVNGDEREIWQVEKPTLD